MTSHVMQTLSHKHTLLLLVISHLGHCMGRRILVQAMPACAQQELWYTQKNCSDNAMVYALDMLFAIARQHDGVRTLRESGDDSQAPLCQLVALSRHTQIHYQE